MKASEADLLIVPGLSDSSPEHWQSRWELKLSTARRVVQDDWERPTFQAWTSRLVEEVEKCTRPVVIIAHSLGAATTVHAAPRFSRNKVVGAFLVSAPSSATLASYPEIEHLFAPLPRDPLPFPSLLVASRNDTLCDMQTATDYALDWGAHLIDAGDAGHINVTSGHGPWPEGLLSFAGFLARLQPAAL